MLFFAGWPVELPLFELTPAASQVVFQGDKLPFVCRASVVDSSTHMLWIRGDGPVLTNKTAGVFVHTRYSPDRTVMINSLVLERLALKDSGIWQCRVQTMRGNVSKTVNIVVISADTLYCTKKETHTNKGIVSVVVACCGYWHEHLFVLICLASLNSEFSRKRYFFANHT